MYPNVITRRARGRKTGWKNRKRILDGKPTEWSLYGKRQRDRRRETSYATTPDLIIILAI